MSNPPSYKVGMMKRCVNKLRTFFIDNYSGVCLRGPISDELIKKLTDLLPSDADTRRWRTEQKEAIHSILRHFVGKVLTDEVIRKICQYLAGNWVELNLGHLFVPWNPLINGSVWACLLVTDVERRVWKDPLYILEFESLMGTSVGHTWTSFYSGGSLQYMLHNDVGIAKWDRDGRVEYDDTDIGGLCFTAKLKFNRKQQRTIFTDMSVSSAQQTHNKKLIKARRGKCIGGFLPNGNCFNCPFGVRNCKLARHSDTYRQGVDGSKLIECENYQYTPDGTKVYHRGYKIKRNQHVCLECLNRGSFRQELLK